MSRKLSVICLLLIAAAFSTLMYADAITYNITFTTNPGVIIPPTSGSFTFDPIVGFTNFLVVWDGFTFDETASANAPIGLGVGCASEASTPAFGFLIISQTANCPPPITYDWGASVSNTNARFQFQITGPATPDFFRSTLFIHGTEFTGANGNWSIAPVSSPVPEPGTISLLLSGLAGVSLLVGTKRLRRSPPAKPSLRSDPASQ